MFPLNCDAGPIVVSGVAGSGKSTVGSALAAATGRPFIDADDLHSPANVAKMAAGTPLTDDDRWPWLDAVGRAAKSGEVVLACSALRRDYRTRIRLHAPDVIFVQLAGDPALVGARLAARSDHFMPGSLLVSQYALLELLEHDEEGLVLDVGPAPADLVKQIVQYLCPSDARS